MKLYHWTLNAKKISDRGFHNRPHRHPEDKEGVWFTDKLLGPSDGIRKDMRLLVIDIPLKNLAQYEEVNAGTGHRAFSIPDEVVNKCEMSWPTVYMDRGIGKINE